MSKLLRVEQVAERLGLRPPTVRLMISKCHLPSVRPARKAVRVREEDVEALIRAGYRSAAPKPAPMARGRVGDARE